MLTQQINDTITSKLDNLTSDFWVQLNTAYIEIFYMKLISLKGFFFEYYNLNDDDFYSIASNIEEEVYQRCLRHFSKQSKEIIGFSVDLFKKKFWYSDGIPRIWNKMTNEDIRLLYRESKSEVECIFELFGIFQLISSPIKLCKWPLKV